MALPKANIPRVIEALQKSENDPEAAIRSLENEAAEHEGEAQALRQAVVAIKLLTGEAVLSGQGPAVQAVSNGPPVGMEAVRRVMREGGVWTARTMLDELEKRGWEPKDAKHPHAAVEAAMDRMFRVKGEIERVGRGEYAYKGFPPSPTFETLNGITVR